MPFSSPEDLPKPGFKPGSPACQVDSLPLSHLGSPYKLFYIQFIVLNINVKEIIHVVYSCKPVLVCSCCCDTIPQAGWLINRKKWLLTVLEAGSLRSEDQQSQVKGRFSDCQSVQLLSPVQLCSLPGSSVHRTLQARILSGLPFPSLGDLPDPGIEPTSPVLLADALPSEPSGKQYVDSKSSATGATVN